MDTEKRYMVEYAAAGHVRTAGFYRAADGAAAVEKFGAAAGLELDTESTFGREGYILHGVQGGKPYDVVAVAIECHC